MRAKDDNATTGFVKDRTFIYQIPRLSPSRYGLYSRQTTILSVTDMCFIETFMNRVPEEEKHIKINTLSFPRSKHLKRIKSINFIRYTLLYRHKN